MRNFLLPRRQRIHGDLPIALPGSEFAYEFDTEPERRFLALSSVKYLIATANWLAIQMAHRRLSSSIAAGRSSVSAPTCSVLAIR